MGKEQRSRTNLPAGTVCYLCERAILDGEAWNRDHVPPQRFYGKSIRTQFNPNLAWLPTHNACNSAYKKDEEYYVAAFVGHSNSATALSVWNDLKTGVAKGHDVGLLKTITSQFGKVVRLDGAVIFNYDQDRAGRIAWKLVRGIYSMETGKTLSENAPKRLILLGPEEVKTAVTDYPWWPLVRDTGPMGTHGAVFDYKWLGSFDDQMRAHAIAFCLWDGLLTLTMFHDPTCRCEPCQKGIWPTDE
jgi:hypothetical protein